MAQLVARDVWDVDAAGSNPVTPTKLVLYAQKISPFRKIGADFLFTITILLFSPKNTVFAQTLSFGTGHRFCVLVQPF